MGLLGQIIGTLGGQEPVERMVKDNSISSIRLVSPPARAAEGRRLR
jgi:hypothetical protein